MQIAALAAENLRPELGNTDPRSDCAAASIDYSPQTLFSTPNGASGRFVGHSYKGRGLDRNIGFSTLMPMVLYMD
jgi:hypothetical protein